MMYFDTDHSGLNKFSGVDDPSFKLVRSVIERMVQETSSPRLCDVFREASGNAHWLVPRVVNTFFTGRTEILNKIVNVIHNRKHVQQQHRFVITGMGGQCKSELCLHIANRVRNEYVMSIFVLKVDGSVANFNSFWGVFR